MAFKDLGLLVVDEEQRFGVKHKERLKQLRTLVDVLTLTATPIPRTLHMSLVRRARHEHHRHPAAGPPRHPHLRDEVRPGAVKEAIERELAARRAGLLRPQPRAARSRDGEVPARSSCRRRASAWRHGQMGEGKLEKVMGTFVEKKLDVLLRTSIIESGIDIPSANTMIVNRADHFGLAQLYQLRGRVGRCRERAYAYLLVPARRAGDEGRAASGWRCCSASPSWAPGFSIASHDLEIRGAGNLLGQDQSGPIAAIGFDLYTQLLEEAVREMRGEPPRERDRAGRHAALAGAHPGRLRAGRPPAAGLLQALRPGRHRRGARRPARRAGGPLRRAAGRGRRLCRRSCR